MCLILGAKFWREKTCWSPAALEKNKIPVFIFPGQKVILPMHSFAQLKTLHFDPPNAVIHVGGKLFIELTLLSEMPIPVQVDQIAIHVHFSIEKNSYRKTAEWLTKHKTSNGVISFPNEVAGFPLSRNNLPALELYEMYERSPSDNSLNTAGIICKNVHMLLRRQESSSSLDMPSGVTLEDGAHVLKCNNLILEPGINKITFNTQVCFYVWVNVALMKEELKALAEEEHSAGKWYPYCFLLQFGWCHSPCGFVLIVLDLHFPWKKAVVSVSECTGNSPICNHLSQPS